MSDVEKKAAPKIYKPGLYLKAANAMLGKSPEGWPEFGPRFALVHPPKSAPWYLRLHDTHVSQASKFQIEAEIMDYFDKVPETSHLALTHRDCEMVFERWQRKAKPFTEKIYPVRFKSEGGYTWRRLPFDPAGGGTPTFDEIMQRTDNPLTLKAWIGSLFVPESDRQQYQWIYGPGENGKSRLAEFIGWLFADSCGGGEPPGKEDRFWTHQCLGKRVMIFPDCDKTFFVNTGLFKSLTGDDLIRIEEKGRPAYTAKLDCKFLILSNNRPHVDGDVATLRRILYCEIAPFEGKRINAREYNALLRSEAPAIIHQCLEEYRVQCEGHGPIPFGPEKQEALISAAEERWEVMAHRWLDLYEKGQLLQIKYCDQPYVRADYMDLIRRYENLGAAEYQRFRDFLSRRYDVSYRAVRLHTGRTARVYVGCSRNDSPPGEYKVGSCTEKDEKILPDHIRPV